RRAARLPHKTQGLRLSLSRGQRDADLRQRSRIPKQSRLRAQDNSKSLPAFRQCHCETDAQRGRWRPGLRCRLLFLSRKQEASEADRLRSWTGRAAQIAPLVDFVARDLESKLPARKNRKTRTG